jgi:hypothetical protein
MPRPHVTARAAAGTCGAFCGVVIVAATLLPYLHASAAVAGDPRMAPESLAAQREPSCKHIELTRFPSWSTSATWTESNELVVVDQIRNQVLRYSANGESLGTIPDVVESSLEHFFPSTVKTHGSNLMFELSGHRLQTLDREYSPVAATTLEKPSRGLLPETQGASSRIASLMDWQPVGNGDIVSFSDVALPAREAGVHPAWRVAFLRFPIAEPWRFTILGDAMPFDASSNPPPCPSQCSPGDALRLYYRLGHEYIAALGDSAFILRMDQLKIYRQTGNTIEPLPVNFAAVTQPEVSEPPALPRFWAPEDYAAVMAKVERSTMPTGLYGWNHFLFVTTRIFDHRSTRWTVTKIDPDTNRILGTYVIPTAAHHLTIAPGPRRWAFIEKGPVKSWNDRQDIRSILFVSAAKFAKDLKGDICSD